ncbi:hypothetical protein C1646_815842 [Rhizophagus diaphanus]|nr:hypothetical protein C1646_815842 [Rhizophagus diaphanus] [Rhizophagus sp. MUCL 43196]
MPIYQIFHYLKQLWPAGKCWTTIVILFQYVLSVSSILPWVSQIEECYHTAPNTRELRNSTAFVDKGIENRSLTTGPQIVYYDNTSLRLKYKQSLNKHLPQVV